MVEKDGNNNNNKKNSRVLSSSSPKASPSSPSKSSIASRDGLYGTSPTSLPSVFVLVGEPTPRRLGLLRSTEEMLDGSGRENERFRLRFPSESEERAEEREEIEVVEWVVAVVADDSVRA
jgi:hypothetical protein